VGVRVRRLHRCAEHSDSFALEDVIAIAAELGVAIVDPRAAVAGDHRASSAGLRACWATQAPVGFAVQATNSTRRLSSEMKKGYVDPLQPGGIDGQEVAPEGGCRVLAEEVSPRELVSLQRGRQTVTGEDRRRRPETAERDLIGAWQLPRVRPVRSSVAPSQPPPPESLPLTGRHVPRRASRREVGARASAAQLDRGPRVWTAC